MKSSFEDSEMLVTARMLSLSGGLDEWFVGKVINLCARKGWSPQAIVQGFELASRCKCAEFCVDFVNPWSCLQKKFFKGSIGVVLVRVQALFLYL